MKNTKTKSPSQINNRLCALLSYAYFSTAESIKKFASDVFEGNADILVDSGAFTLHHNGMKKSFQHINLKDYINFCHQLEQLKKELGTPIRYFTLDKLGDEKTTLNNLKCLESEGLKPVPIFTRGSDLKRLYEFLDKYETVALGNLPKGSKNTLNYLAMIQRKLSDEQRKQIHLLGQASLPLVKRFNPQSIDHASYSSNLYALIKKHKRLSKEHREIAELFHITPQIMYEFRKQIHPCMQAKAHNALCTFLHGVYMNKILIRHNIKQYFVFSHDPKVARVFNWVFRHF